MKAYILILTDFGLRLPMRLAWYESFDITMIADGLRSAGYEPIITHYEDHDLYRLIFDLNIKYCLPATSYLKGYRHLVNSVLSVLDYMRVELIPALPNILAYENKTLMIALANALDLPIPHTFTVATAEQMRLARSKLGLPFVIKDPEGYGSQGVSLVDSHEAFEHTVRQYFRKRASGTEGVGSLVVQQFIPGMEGDWKVIVVGNTAAALYRKVRKDDFRASGSHIFEFRRPPKKVLNCAMQVCRNLIAPWVSCDIIETENKCFLVEYQCVHFGTTTTDKALFHFQLDDKGQWNEIKGPVDMEKNMVEAIVRCLNKEVQMN